MKKAEFWNMGRAHSPPGYMRAENGRTPASLLVRSKKPRVFHLRLLLTRSNPNPMSRYNDEVIKARDGRPSFRQCFYDTAAKKKRRRGILNCWRVEAKETKVEQEGEC
jgi:hypothetical protein